MRNSSAIPWRTFPCRPSPARSSPLENGLDPGKEWIGLLPGSRKSEVRHTLPEMLKAARQLASTRDCQFLLPVAPTLSAEFVAEMRKLANPAADSAATPSVHFVSDARAALYFARASIVASGTATVQAALMGNPFVIVYRMSLSLIRLPAAS